jgi:rhamnopyranosyl-N-acetylglucosaminyl-diphospho-decaprenol beta-1,3/1,4-galactofuranosyltransferase
MKIIAVVPTFNRPECLLKNISCLLAQQTQLDSIIIVNNGSDQSTEDTLQAAGFLRNKKIRYIRLNKNIGASGGFSSGMKAAIDDSADWVWGMDDDAFPEPDALQALLQVLSPTEKLCYWSNVDEDISFDHPVKQVNGLIFVGFLISQKLISDIGYPDQRFFMYHDDTEYSQRINRAGYQILKVRDSKIRHLGYNKRGPPIK